MDIYDGHNYHLKKGGYMDKDICSSGVFGIFSHTFILKLMFFRFINGITFRRYCVILCIFGIMVWIIILNKLMLYRVPTYP